MNKIFLVSQPRSGSTLLQGIISNNDFVSTTSEPWLLLPLLSMFDPDLSDGRYGHSVAVNAINEFAEKAGGIKIIEHAVSACADSIYSNFATDKTRYFLDKTPHYYFILPIIKRLFPDARIIVLKRNPMAVLNSLIEFPEYQGHLKKLYMYRFDILKAPFLIQSFLDKFQDDDNVLAVRYEDFVLCPRYEIKRIFSWLELPYEDGVLNYRSNKKIYGNWGDTDSMLKHTAPSAASIDKWHEKLKDGFWRDFFYGYSAYLGDEFLQGYGGYRSLSSTDTKEFNYFKLLCENNYSEKLTSFLLRRRVTKILSLLMMNLS